MDELMRDGMPAHECPGWATCGSCEHCKHGAEYDPFFFVADERIYVWLDSGYGICTGDSSFPIVVGLESKMGDGRYDMPCNGDSWVER